MLKSCDIWKSDETLPFPMGSKRETGRCRAGNGWVPCRPNREYGCRTAQCGRYHAARNEKCYAAGNGAPVGYIPERSSAIAIASSTGLPGCCIAKSAVLTSLLFAKPACRIVKSVVLPSAVLIGLSDCQICRLLSLLYCQVCRKHGVSRVFC